MIEAGHPWPQIRKYTLGQIRVFVRAAQRRQRHRLADAMLAACAANGKGEDIQREIERLRR